MIGDVICQHVNKATVLDVQRNDGDKCDLDGSYDSPTTILSHMSLNIYIQLHTDISGPSQVHIFVCYFKKTMTT